MASSVVEVEVEEDPLSLEMKGAAFAGWYVYSSAVLLELAAAVQPAEHMARRFTDYHEVNAYDELLDDAMLGVSYDYVLGLSGRDLDDRG